MKPLRQYAYRTDIPTASGTPRNYAHGVPAICALDDGRLLILEREFFVPKKIIGSFVECRLYLVDPSRSTVINADTRLGAIDEYDFMAKTLISSWTTTLNLARRDIANYEGMCLGPRLTDGRQTLILVNDSQGGYGNSLLRLHDYIKVVALE